MRVKNKHFYSNDQELLDRLEDDYRFIGFEVRTEPGHLTVLCMPKTKKIRECKECKENKPLKEFPRQSDHRAQDGRGKVCKSCVANLEREEQKRRD